MSVYEKEVPLARLKHVMVAATEIDSLLRAGFDDPTWELFKALPRFGFVTKDMTAGDKIVLAAEWAGIYEQLIEAQKEASHGASQEKKRD